jgi:hypothetical protein
MAHFIVKFFKDILGDNGRDSEVCQHFLEVEAANSGDACELAKRRFCESERLQHWSLHADRLHVTESDQPPTPLRH